MLSNIVDTHAHLNMSQFDSDREAVIKRATEVGVKTIVVIGTDLESSYQALNIANSHPGIWATVGFHPHDAGIMQTEDIDTIANLTNNKKVVAIGEIGLDYYRNRAPREIQIQVFKWQLELADRMNLPVVIHSRQANSDTLSLLREWVIKPKRNSEAIGIIHCFSGDIDIVRQYLDMGFYISFGAYISYPSSSLSEVIRIIPANRLIIETDSPFLPPQSHRGKRNEPAYINITLEVLARVRKQPVEMLARQTTENATRVFYRFQEII